MTVVDFDERTITFLNGGNEVTLTWGELNFLKHYRVEGVKNASSAALKRARR